jgi:hypothetical protein
MVIIQAFLNGSITDEPWFLNQLNEQAGVAVDSRALARELFMSFNQARQLSDISPSLTIGSHAHTHRRLAGLDDDSQRYELTESRRILEAQVGREVRALAYPFGWPGTYTPRTVSLAAQTGYSVAFTSRVGVNRHGSINPFEVKRLGVGRTDSLLLLRARTAFYGAFGQSFL